MFSWVWNRIFLNMLASEVVLRTFVEIDGFLVQEHRRRELVHLADDRRARLRGVDDDDVVGGDAPEVDLFGGKRLAAPEPATRGSRGGSVLFENPEQVADVGSPQLLFGLEGQLEKAGLKVAGEQEQVVRVDQSLLGVGAQEVVGVTDDELVERRARRHENPNGPGATASSPELLPGRGDRPGVADEDRRLEAADVDAQLECVGADHSGDFSATQAGLDLAPVEGQVAGPIATQERSSIEPL